MNQFSYARPQSDKLDLPFGDKNEEFKYKPENPDYSYMKGHNAETVKHILMIITDTKTDLKISNAGSKTNFSIHT